MFMDKPATQNPAEAFASIISMMLEMIRGRGWRGLFDLPTIWLVSRKLRRMAEEFTALFAAFKAGTLPLRAPAPQAVPQEWQPAPAQPPATPRPAARPAAPRRRRPRPQPAPAKPARAGVRARTRAVPQPSSPNPHPHRPARVRAIDPQENSGFAALPLHVHFVTITY
jgi:hypothetical protein